MPTTSKIETRGARKDQMTGWSAINKGNFSNTKDTFLILLLKLTLTITASNIQLAIFVFHN